MAVSKKEKEALVAAYLCGGRAFFGIEGVREVPVTWEPRREGDRSPWVDDTGQRLPYDLVRVYPKEGT